MDINPQGKKLILSIDGGGMRGMIAIAMLAELEKLTGKPAYDLFDMVAGTSTGAVIAAGLGLGFTAGELLEQVYRNRLPEAFRVQPRGILLYLRYLFGGLRNLYDLQPFVDALGPLSQGKKIRDIQKPILFLTTRDLRTANTYFIVSKGPGAAAFADWPITGAVGASGAAPIFFPPVLGNLVDGGVGAYGNPSLAATTEALNYLQAEGFSEGNIIHFSLGTGYRVDAKAEGAGAHLWLYDWVLTIITAGLDDSSLQQVLNTRAIYKDRVDFRRFNPWLTQANVGEVLGVPLAGKPDPSKLELDSYEPAQVELMEAIGRAYAGKVNWTESDYMPFITDGPQRGQPRDGGHPLPGILPVTWRAPYV